MAATKTLATGLNVASSSGGNGGKKKKKGKGNEKVITGFTGLVLFFRLPPSFLALKLTRIDSELCPKGWI